MPGNWCFLVEKKYGDIDRRVVLCIRIAFKLIGNQLSEIMLTATNEGQAPQILKGENNDIQGNST